MDETKIQSRDIKSELVIFDDAIEQLGKAFNEVAVSADSLTTVTQDIENRL